jgi:hypothetical protein
MVAYPGQISGNATVTGTMTVGSAATLGDSCYVDHNVIVGGAAVLGDGGVGEIQLTNVTTAPTGNPTGGGVIFASNGTPIWHDPNGYVGTMVGPQSLPLCASPSGAMAESVQRNQITSTANSPTSGTLYVLSVFMYAGTKVGHLGFGTGMTGAASPSHWWMAILNSSFLQVAHTADQLTAAISSNTWHSLALTTTYTVPSTGVYYLAINVTGHHTARDGGQWNRCTDADPERHLHHRFDRTGNGRHDDLRHADDDLPGLLPLRGCVMI